MLEPAWQPARKGTQSLRAPFKKWHIFLSHHRILGAGLQSDADATFDRPESLNRDLLSIRIQSAVAE